MGSLSNSQDNCGSIPPSSSPAPSSGSECDIAGSTHASLPATSPPYAPSPESSSARVSDSKDNDYATGSSVRNATEPNSPLLSPFAISKGDRLVCCKITDSVRNFRSRRDEARKPGNITSQSTHFQDAIGSFPSSPSVPHSSSDAISNASSLASNVLQSPFGIHLKTASSLPDDLFVSSSPENLISLAERLHTEQSTEVVYCIGNEGRKDNNAPSDSGDSTAGAHATPRVFKYAHRATVPSPYLVSEFAEMYGSEETIICPDGGNMNETDPASKPLYQTPGASESMCAFPAAFREPISSADSNSSSTNDLLSGNGNKSLSEEPKTESKHSNHCSPLKRARDPDDKESIIAPKRMTLASQQKQHRKLASPFRSPLLTKPSTGNIFTPDSRPPNQPSSAPSKLRMAGDENRPSTPNPKLTNSLIRPRSPLSSSAKAKAPFKSPLVTSSPTTLHLSTSRTIQELERKVQLLRRAMKIKREDEEVKLMQLVQKWRVAGRDAAWELWRIVRDNEGSTEASYPGTNSKSSGGSFEGSWGWAGPSRSSQSSSWGWDAPPDSDVREDDIRSEELESPTKVERELFDSLRQGPTVPRTTMLPPTPRGAYHAQVLIISTLDSYNRNVEAGPDQGNGTQEDEHAPASTKSLGTMLHQLGIAHETLGWVEEEGDFMDA